MPSSSLSGLGSMVQRPNALGPKLQKCCCVQRIRLHINDCDPDNDSFLPETEHLSCHGFRTDLELKLCHLNRVVAQLPKIFCNSSASLSSTANHVLPGLSPMSAACRRAPGLLLWQRNKHVSLRLSCIHTPNRRRLHHSITGNDITDKQNFLFQGIHGTRS